MESEWQNTNNAIQCERRKTYMSNKNKGYNKEDSFIAESVVIEEAPIEATPVVAEKVKEEPKEVPEVRQENKSISPIKKDILKQKAKVVLITRNSCIVRTLTEPQHNIDLYGAEFMSKKIGDIVEF